MLLPLISLAHATATYPGEVATQLAMPCTPQCTLCHESNIGGAGTVVTPFGQALMDRGLLGAGQVDLLTQALTAAEADGLDADGDGVVDTEELAAGEDPNGGAALCDVLAPTYGCFNHTPGAPAALGVALALVVARRSRYRRIST